MQRETEYVNSGIYEVNKKRGKDKGEKRKRKLNDEMEQMRYMLKKMHQKGMKMYIEEEYRNTGTE